MNSAEVSQSRIARVAEELRSASLDALLVSTPVSMGYLHGFYEGAGERFMALAIHPSGDYRLICPALSETQARRAGIQDVRPWRDGDDPMAEFRQLAKEWDLRSAVIAVDNDMSAKMLLDIQAVLPAALFRPGAEVLAKLMRVKDESELQAMREAGRIVDETFRAVLPKIRSGMTERQLQRLITDDVRERGGEPTFCIIGTGANSAEPHHLTDDSPIEQDAVLILDFGCSFQGYQSDITRTIHVGKAGDEARRVYEIVLRSHLAGCEAAKPGVAAEMVDRAARKVIVDAGYGEFFFHRTGHGIGMQVHEEPYIVEGNTLPLEPGHCFSVEPGIYLAGRFGVRIENCVTVTSTGCSSLNAPPPDTLVEVG